MISFFMAMVPPTVTDQEHRIGKRKDGSQYIYKNKKLEDARAKLRAHMAKYSPENPITGPVRLKVMWMWQKVVEKPEFRTTKPDTDNLNKMLKDVMTELGFWKDDAQVCVEQIEKYWVPMTSCPGIYIEVEELPEHVAFM